VKWKKLGRIFNPTEYKLANNCFAFAKSPQALVCDDFVRVYFSAVAKDKIGKYLSHVLFVDFDKKFRKIKNISDKTVISLGELGSFDEHGIFPMNIVRDDNKILGYTTGWNRKVSVSVDASIGLAISEDNGLTFKKYSNGPILTASLDEPFLVGDAFVAKFKNAYHMWYIYGYKWIVDPMEDEPQRIYKIVHAISNNGISWEREGRHIITDKLNENECQALPTVIYFENKYHMFFCYRQATGFRKIKERGYRIGYAFSEDLVNWIRDDDNVGIDVSEEGWDSDMVCYPHVFQCEGEIYLLYNGNEFGRFGFGIAVLDDAAN
jgi:sucrose-6-phosphate hydrolase SacC (GH32 family)